MNTQATMGDVKLVPRSRGHDTCVVRMPQYMEDESVEAPVDSGRAAVRRPEAGLRSVEADGSPISAKTFAHRRSQPGCGEPPRPVLDWESETLRAENAELRERLAEVEQELAEGDYERQMLVIEIGAVNQELDRLVRTLEKQAITDPLTGLYNKRHLWEQLSREVARTARTKRSLCAMFVDIDFFKRCNDDFGHATGDEVLRQVADLVGHAVRRCDLVCGIDAGSTLARFGGEEFVLVLPETDIQGAQSVAERVRREVEGATFVGAGGAPELRITISIGVSEYATADEGDFKGLLDRADRALYAAKRNGRNRVETCLTDT